MEWIRDHLFEILGAIFTAIGGASWLFRLESKVTMNSKAVGQLEDAIKGHVADASRHANGRSIEKLETRLDEVEKTLSSKIDELSRTTRDDIGKLLDKIWDERK